MPNDTNALCSNRVHVSRTQNRFDEFHIMHAQVFYSDYVVKCADKIGMCAKYTISLLMHHTGASEANGHVYAGACKRICAEVNCAESCTIVKSWNVKNSVTITWNGQMLVKCGMCSFSYRPSSENSACYWVWRVQTVICLEMCTSVGLVRLSGAYFSNFAINVQWLNGHEFGSF